jgi:hypothetical protein
MRKMGEVAIAGLDDGRKLHVIALTEGFKMLLVLFNSLADEFQVLLRTNRLFYFIIRSHDYII